MCYFVGHGLLHLCVCTFATLTPVRSLALRPAAVLLHASLRLRNIRNKITNRMESVGLRRTLMGLFLDELGMESDKFTM